MSWRIYSDAAASVRPSQPALANSLPAPLLDTPEGYIPEPGLADAVDVALALSQPLLLTGEPGTGKTQLAYNIASRLGLAEPLVFNTKTTSVARDLFYRYDALRHFRDSHMNGRGDGSPIDSYIEYEALGLAILLSLPDDQAPGVLPPVYRDRPRGRSVVLIDEVDKAPRDLPNDVLFEIEAFAFEVKETGHRFKASPEHRPVVVLTSNSERALPEPFLRRCIFYHLSFPDTDHLKRIIASRLGKEIAGRPWISDAVERFLAVRKVGMDKPPATAELLAWLRFLAAMESADGGKNPLREGIPKASYPILAKSKDALQNLKDSLKS